MSINESWKPVTGYEGLYEVSDLGRVRSYLRPNCRILKPQKQYHGGLLLVLYKDKSATQHYVHRLVANAFIPNPENKEQVNHKDGNRGNNILSNLEWNTRSENIRHSYDVLKRKSSNHGRFGKNSNTAKSVLQKTRSGELVKTWDCIKDVERTLGIHASSVSKACHGWMPTYKGFVWEFPSCG